MVELVPWPQAISLPRRRNLLRARRMARGRLESPELHRTARVLAAAAGPEDRRLLQVLLRRHPEHDGWLRPLSHEAQAINLVRAAGLRELGLTVPAEFLPTREAGRVRTLRREYRRLQARLDRRGLRVSHARRLPLELRVALLGEVLRRIGPNRLPRGLRLRWTVCSGGCPGCFQLPYCDAGPAVLERERAATSVGAP